MHSSFVPSGSQRLVASPSIGVYHLKHLHPCQCTTRANYLGRQLSQLCRTRASNNRSNNSDGIPEERQRSHKEASTSTPSPATQIRPALLLGICFALLAGAANRVLFKIALVPMGNYVFFLAQFQNFGYLLVYFTTLLIRVRAGAVTSEMLQVDKRPFILIGACEAASQVFSMIGASHLPGVLIPIINQSYLLWSFLLAALILKTRFHPSQLIGALLVVVGVALSVLPPDLAASLWHGNPSTAASTLSGSAGIPGVELKYVALVVACFSLPALASIMKDKIFRDERERLGRPLDIFVVNSFGSAFQALFVVLLLPVTTSLARVPLSQLPDYLVRGSQCLRGLTPACGTDCSLSPVLPFAYIVMNLLFNVSMLLLLRSIGAVGTTMVSSFLVPLTIAAFTLVPATFLPPPTLSSNFLLGAFILVCGQLIFNMPKLKAAFDRPKPA
ncbi:hypothetical protein DUNSADRAFT_12181 [Dunaliella salina]|uniref:Uncharacterized protein n=1 Tax=Dunaliella salina TaxID=3046 RepID=A0ABQ7GBU1_DUNSA|nr:hypothetical protein DUNSADRAFT_12181 [Dunaliella salina]|eukprot:KAF5832068.1 hypothetical protein DUNSADRAFT_12181 [Dunaliella salina]